MDTPTYEFVATFYAEGKKDEDPAWVEFSRPQDFATNKAWVYRLIELNRILPRPAHFKAHFWVNVTLTDAEALGVVGEVIKLGVPDYRRDPKGYPQMSPTDCLKEDDYWDSSLGEPNYCPEDDDDFYWRDEVPQIPDDEASRQS